MCSQPRFFMPCYEVASTPVCGTITDGGHPPLSPANFRFLQIAQPADSKCEFFFGNDGAVSYFQAVIIYGLGLAMQKFRDFYAVVDAQPHQRIDT